MDSSDAYLIAGGVMLSIGYTYAGCVFLILSLLDAVVGIYIRRK